LYISRFYNQINFFITLINGGDFDYCGGDFVLERFWSGGDFDKCGGDIDGAILQWGDLTCIPSIGSLVAIVWQSVSPTAR